MKQPTISHIAIRKIINGEVIEFGSKCYGTSDGSQFLGLLPYSAEVELLSLLSSDLPQTLRVSLERIAQYSGFRGDV